LHKRDNVDQSATAGKNSPQHVNNVIPESPLKRRNKHRVKLYCQLSSNDNSKNSDSDDKLSLVSESSVFLGSATLPNYGRIADGAELASGVVHPSDVARTSSTMKSAKVSRSTSDRQKSNAPTTLTSDSSKASCLNASTSSVGRPSAFAEGRNCTARKATRKVSRKVSRRLPPPLLLSSNEFDEDFPENGEDEEELNLSGSDFDEDVENGADDSATDNSDVEFDVGRLKNIDEVYIYRYL